MKFVRLSPKLTHRLIVRFSTLRMHNVYTHYCHLGLVYCLLL